MARHHIRPSWCKIFSHSATISFASCCATSFEPSSNVMICVDSDGRSEPMNTVMFREVTAASRRLKVNVKCFVRFAKSAHTLRYSDASAASTIRHRTSNGIDASFLIQSFKCQPFWKNAQRKSSYSTEGPSGASMRLNQRRTRSNCSRACFIREVLSRCCGSGPF